MKWPPQTLRNQTPTGFTLIELLVVISLIAVLAAMALAAAGPIMKRIKRSQIEKFMAELEIGLEDYKVDNAIYPMNPPDGGPVLVPGYSGIDTEAVGGASILYKHLSGDSNEDGQVDQDETVYVERLDFWSNSNHPGGTVRSVDLGDGKYLIVDPLGSPVRYLAYPPGKVQDLLKQGKIKNPTYDLWSIAGAEVGSVDFSDQATWITNWGSN